MAQRLYIMPISGAGTAADPRRPKYSSLFDGAWSMIDGGANCLVGADVSNAAHTSVSANSDVMVLDFERLDTSPSVAERNAANVYLSSRVPGFSVRDAETWRQNVQRFVEHVQPGLLGRTLVMNALRLR